jgi:oligopeptide/dipeptide ABC transporter ATP-binding protein
VIVDLDSVGVVLRQVQNDYGLSYIAHDLSVVRYISQRIVVLYRGRIMECGDAAAVYDRPRHPYTRALLDAAPVADPELQSERRRTRVRTTPSDASTAPDSCVFAPRCAPAIEICRMARPSLEPTDDGSLVACHRWRELGPHDGAASVETH